MKYKKVVRLYSNSRVAKYYRATNRNKNKAVMLYFANMKIAQAFHPLLSSFEVILRNQLHYALAHHFSDGNWIINQKTGFMIAPSLTYTNKRTKKKVTNDWASGIAFMKHTTMRFWLVYPAGFSRNCLPDSDVRRLTIL